jgi:hypothetical protein
MKVQILLILIFERMMNMLKKLCSRVITVAKGIKYVAEGVKYVIEGIDSAVEGLRLLRDVLEGRTRYRYQY